MRWVEESDWPKLLCAHLKWYIVPPELHPHKVRYCSLCHQEGIEREARRVAWREDGTGAPWMWFECGELHRHLPMRVVDGDATPQIPTHWIRIEVFWAHIDELLKANAVRRVLEGKRAS